MKILIADDSRAMRQIVSRTLRQAGFGGYDVVEAADGRVAYDCAVTQGVDLVLSDWNMPRLSGIEVLRALRAGGFDTPFGFVTSEVTPGFRQMAEDAGALFLLTKPFAAEHFRDVLDPILG